MIENMTNHHIYIGSSNDINRRMIQHFKGLKAGNHHSTYLQNAFNKYGRENFDYSIVITCHIDMLLWYEQQFLDQWHPEYNASGVAGRIEYTEEVRNKVSKALKGRPLLESTKKKLSESMMGKQNWKGKKHSDKSRKKMSDSRMGKPAWNKGIPSSDESRRKLSLAHKGRKFSEETRRKISLAGIGNKYCKGKKLSEETKRKISESEKGRVFSDGTRQKMSDWQIGRKLSNETRHRISVTRTGKHYPKVSESAKGKKRSDVAKKNMSDAQKRRWADKKAKKENT